MSVISMSTLGTMAAVGSAGAGIYGAVNQGINARKNPGSGGYDMYIPKAVGEQTDIGRQNVAYLGGMGRGLTAGDPWAKFGDFEKWQRKRMQLEQQRAMFGDQGSRYGAYGTGMEAGALTGLGGAATQKSLRPLMLAYQQGSQQIEDILSQQKSSAMQNTQAQYLQGMGQMAQPFGGGQAIPWQVPAAPQVEQADWGAVASNLKDLRGEWGRPRASSTPFTFESASPFGRSSSPLVDQWGWNQDRLNAPLSFNTAPSFDTTPSFGG